MKCFWKDVFRKNYGGFIMTKTISSLLNPLFNRTELPHCGCMVRFKNQNCNSKYITGMSYYLNFLLFRYNLHKACEINLVFIKLVTSKVSDCEQLI